MIVIRYNSHFLPLFYKILKCNTWVFFFIVNSLKLKVISLNLKVNTLNLKVNTLNLKVNLYKKYFECKSNLIIHIYGFMVICIYGFMVICIYINM